MPQPPRLPLLALPLAVWEDHLLLMLTCKDAARLGSTCKALRGVVREHFKDIGRIQLDKLQAALTTFPRAQSAEPYSSDMSDWDDAQIVSLAQMTSVVEWLREGKRGGSITRLSNHAHTFIGFPIVDVAVHAALRGGALPSLRSVAVLLDDDTHRASLTEGLLRGMHELLLEVRGDEHEYDVEAQLAALGLVRHLPALAKLTLRVCSDLGDGDPVPWPPFIPRHLRALIIRTDHGDPLHGGKYARSLFQALPGMLGASGARLDNLQVEFDNFDFDYLGDALIHLAQALRCCSPTLRRLALWQWCEDMITLDPKAEDYASQVERLRVQWAELLAGVSACRDLQVLDLPQDIQVEPLFPPGTAFARLTDLHICTPEREHPPPAGAMGLWEVMASGGLSSLAKLNVGFIGYRCRGPAGLEDMKTRVAPALEAMAGTLTRLDMWYENGWRSAEVDLAYAVGVAVGKLRRLKDLTLILSGDGRTYHTVARGLAASGGDRPLPLLWRVRATSWGSSNADLLASLLLPSVRVFASCHKDARSALLTACALQQAGYKHTWALRVDRMVEGRDLVQGIAQCSFGHDPSL
jgi:hypothetical protein